MAVGVDTAERQRVSAEKLAAAQVRRTELEARWDGEKKLADRILEIRATLRGSVDAAAAAARDARSAPMRGRPGQSGIP